MPGHNHRVPPCTRQRNSHGGELEGTDKCRTGIVQPCRQIPHFQVHKLPFEFGGGALRPASRCLSMPCKMKRRCVKEPETMSKVIIEKPETASETGVVTDEANTIRGRIPTSVPNMPSNGAINEMVARLLTPVLNS